MQDKKYIMAGMYLNDGDKFGVQEDKPGENKYNPSGIGIHTFNHKSYINWELNPEYKQED